jgi:hypothetical protein
LAQAWKELFTIENFWEKVKVLNPEQVKYMVDKLNNHPQINIYFITAREATAGRPLVKQCINALKAIGWSDPQVIVSFQKGRLARALDLSFFLDDRAENCVEVALENHSTQVFILDKPYNRILQDKYFRTERINRLEEFTDAVLNFLV